MDRIPPGHRAHTPEAAILGFLDAVANERWADAVTYIAEDRGMEHAEQWRRLFLERPQSPALSAADYQRMYPTASPEVVAWHVARHEEARTRRVNDVATMFAGVSSNDELRGLDGPSLLRSILEGADLRYQGRLAYGAAGYALVPEEHEAFSRRRSIRVVGQVADGTNRVIVVYREHGLDAEGGPWEGEPELIEVTRRPDASWALPLNHRLTGETGATVFLVGPDDSDKSAGAADT